MQTPSFPIPYQVGCDRILELILCRPAWPSCQPAISKQSRCPASSRPPSGSPFQKHSDLSRLQDGPRLPRCVVDEDPLPRPPRGISDGRLSCHGDMFRMCDQGISCLGWFGSHGNTRTRRRSRQETTGRAREDAAALQDLGDIPIFFFTSTAGGLPRRPPTSVGTPDAMIVVLSRPSRSR